MGEPHPIGESPRILCLPRFRWEFDRARRRIWGAERDRIVGMFSAQPSSNLIRARFARYRPKSRLQAWARDGLVIGALGMGALGLGGCKDLSVSSANLDALLDSDNQLRHMAEVRSGIRYYMESMIDPRWFGKDNSLFRDREVKVEDPAYTALQNLLVLADGDGARPEHKHIVQVRQFSRYGLRSPGVLVRERAILELADHAVRLELRDLNAVLTDTITSAEIANGAELSALLGGMIDTFEPVVRQGQAAGSTALADFELACQQIDETRIDLDGVWRLLKALETFAARVDIEREVFTPMVDLSVRLQKRAVLLALAGSTVDASPRVRSANLVAQYRAFGEPVLAEALLRLRTPSPAEPDARFGLQTQAIAEDFVLSTLFRLIAENGLPQRNNLTDLEFAEDHFADLRSILTIVNERALFESQTRVAAMQALGEILPGGPSSIREEVWIDWWQTWSAAEIERMKSMRPEQGASTAP